MSLKRKSIVAAMLVVVLLVGAITASAMSNNGWSNFQWNTKPLQRNGSVNGNVRLVQAALNMNMGAGLATDGNFGSGTEGKVKTFQGYKNLTADGLVGSNTWYALQHHAAGTGLQTEYVYSADWSCYYWGYKSVLESSYNIRHRQSNGMWYTKSTTNGLFYAAQQ